MNKIEILKELIIMVKRKNHHCAWGLGSRSETSRDNYQRSKDIRAFIVDLFDVDDEDDDARELLGILGEEINRNVYGGEE